ncbi:peptidase [Streptomyces sp. NRRL B-24484]|uniref:peptidase n=1 Tax=Streptomyces sp. NRRL B-24484 TaxID=1463833 RepID=UPI000A427E22|nr:peptidase [Streptomyces sp. NRRL B-24484]
MRAPMMRSLTLRSRAARAAAVLPIGLGALLAAAPSAAAASPSPAPSGSADTAPVTTAGTTFLTATPLPAGRTAAVSASTGDYLYWAFAASEGQTDTVHVTVTLPPSGDRHGAQTWSVELFDGLRRRQSCTAGPQNATADTGTASVSMSCALRQIRSWAEPWSGDPLPGTYYVRLSVADVPQQDLGLAAQVKLQVAAKGGADDAQPEGGELKAPLVPPVNAGSTAAPDASAATPSAKPSASAPAAPGTVEVAAPAEPESHWYTGLFSGWNTRWYWTVAGGVLAALAGVWGYTLTRHPRGRRPAGSAPVPPQAPAPQHPQYRS